MNPCSHFFRRASSALLCVFTALMLSGCAGIETRASRSAPAIASSVAKPEPVRHAGFEKDRRAILAMAGEFRVNFTFRETVAFEPGYVPVKAERSGAFELVEVIEDRGDFISLQHILVMGDEDDRQVIKHWRQDWQYQPAQVLRYRGDQRWVPEAVDAERARSAWSQTVYEVDDAPRYGGLGHWRHSDGETVWESDYGWRPLPRREHTTREDYQLMGAINRHVLTANGWAHEQINTKLIVDGEGGIRPLVREQGLNTYRRIDDHDFSAGREYWQKTQGYWAQVRALFDSALWRPQGLHLKGTLDGAPRFAPSFALAERVAKGERVDAALIETTLRKYWNEG
ncbi:MAG: DUF6607 family protein [Lysobacterales bacterium]